MTRLQRALMMLCMISAPATAQQMTPDLPDVGSWRSISHTDTMTDAKAFLIVNSTAGSASDVDAPVSLMIGCDDPLRTFLRTEGAWYSRLGNGYLIAVTHRVDDGTPVRGHWFFSNSRQGANTLSADLIKALRRGSKVRFRVSSFRADHEAVFDLAGTDQAIASLERACATNRAARRKGSGKRS